jgi:hypothetical protein
MTMTEETQVSPVAETQNPATEPAKDAPAVAPQDVDKSQEQPQEPESSEDDGDKAIKRMQRRIDKRTADLYQERAQRQALEQRIAAIESQTNGQPEQQAKQVDPYELAKEIAKVERVTDKANEIAREGEKRFKGEFGEAVKAVAEEAGPLFDQRGKPTDIGEAILDSEDPAALLHYLGKNPDLAAELQGLTPAQLGRRMARMEAQMSVKPIEKPVSKAPTPAKPIAGGAATKDPASMSMDEYMALRKAQGARWAR